MFEEIEKVRALVKDRKNYAEIASATGVNAHWLIKFANKAKGVSGCSRKGLDYIQRLKRHFEGA